MGSPPTADHVDEEVMAAVAATLAAALSPGTAPRGEPGTEPVKATHGPSVWSLAGRQQQMAARLHALRAARRPPGRGGS